MKLSEKTTAYFGGISALARLASASRQRVAYWVRVGYHVDAPGVVRSGPRQVGVAFDAHAAIVSAFVVPHLKKLGWLSPGASVAPADLVPEAAGLLRPVRGRSLADAAPVEEWIKWLQ